MLRYISSNSLVGFVLLATTWSPHTAADTVFARNDVVVSNPRVSLPDPEFNPIDSQLAWQDSDGRLWVADIDPATGDLSPRSGRGKLLDRNLVPLKKYGNGPEYAFGESGASVVYTKLVAGNSHLATAWQDAAGRWRRALLGRGANRGGPGGTPPSTLEPARIAYKLAVGDREAVAWRVLDDPTSEGRIAGDGRYWRWIEGQPALSYATDVDGIREVAWLDIETRQRRLIAQDGRKKNTPYVWWAPEYQTYLMVCLLDDTSSIGIYRQGDTGWRLINELSLEFAEPNIDFPEPFVYDGISYVVLVTSNEIGRTSARSGPSSIWVVGVDPEFPFHRRVNADGRDHPRADPEVMILDDGPAVYYTEIRSPTLKVLRRASTGL